MPHMQKGKQMTLNELKENVAMLGFEREIDDMTLFISSVNTALSMIFTDRPVLKTAYISTYVPPLTFYREKISHTANETMSFHVKGKALSFRSTGRGEVIINDSSGDCLFLLTRDGQKVSSFIMREADILLRGDDDFTLFDFSVFKYTDSERQTDIPIYTPRREIAITDSLSDFKLFTKQPMDRHGAPIDAEVIEGHKLSLPFDWSGEIKIEYQRKPISPSIALQDADIDISPECSHLLPLLTASFMWLDDDAQKAQYYMSLYQSGMAEIKRYSPIISNSDYPVNGWA